MRSRRLDVLRWLHFIVMSRLQETRSWVVSFSILSEFGPFRSHAGPASSRSRRGTSGHYQRCGRRTRRSARPRSSGGSRRKYHVVGRRVDGVGGGRVSIFLQRRPGRDLGVSLVVRGRVSLASVLQAASSTHFLDICHRKICITPQRETAPTELSARFPTIRGTVKRWIFVETGRARVRSSPS